MAASDGGMTSDIRGFISDISAAADKQDVVIDKIKELLTAS